MPFPGPGLLLSANPSGPASEGAGARRLQAVHVTLDVDLADELAVLSERNRGS
jgi:hypothetical protein